MNWILCLFLSVALGVTPIFAQTGAPAPTPAPDQPAWETDLGWPRQVASGDQKVVMYQPQVEKWDQNQLEARAAISLETKASPRPLYGVVLFTARTEVDKDRGMVALQDVTTTKLDFPQVPTGVPNYEDIIRESVPALAAVISLPRLEANLVVTQAERKVARLPVKNDPPRIFFSTTPATLILIDGKPALRPVAGTKLLRVINTRAPIFLDESSGRYYLDLMDNWLEAPGVEGPWAPAKSPPASLEKARQAIKPTAPPPAAPAPPGAAEEKPGQAEKPPMPKVFVSTTPAELIQTQGRPEFAPISGTNLLRLKNTNDHLFLNTPTQDYYLSLSGRWFRSKSLEEGPWEFVPGRELPPDFAQIPENHPSGEVLAAVPGTPQAREAVIENSIPQTATVKRSEAKLTTTYDGEPQFEPIEDTPLQYAVNSPTPVIKTSPTTYYAVENGVWFTSSSPAGPWVVADSVPPPIYQIPPSSPVHNVTYVRVYGSTPEVVYVGYTPGYLGTLVSLDDVVVFGTGYPYRPWIGSYWIGYPATFGFGWGWSWGWARPWWWRPAWAAPSWWGPWWGNPAWWHGWGGGWGGGWGWRGGWGWGAGWHPWRSHYWPGYCRPGLLCGNLYQTWGRKVIAPPHPPRALRDVKSLRHDGKLGLKRLDRDRLKLKRDGKGRRANDVFAGRDDKVYRKQKNKWQEYDSKGRWKDVKEKDRDRRLDRGRKDRLDRQGREDRRLRTDGRKDLQARQFRESRSHLNAEASARTRADFRERSLQRGGRIGGGKIGDGQRGGRTGGGRIGSGQRGGQVGGGRQRDSGQRR